MSTELEFARASLHKAEQEIVAGEHRIREQVARIRGLSASGHDTRGSERLLRSLERALGEWREHRDEVLERLERLERKPT
jgi:hypothetical protein